MLHASDLCHNDSWLVGWLFGVLPIVHAFTVSQQAAAFPASQIARSIVTFRLLVILRRVTSFLEAQLLALGKRCSRQ